MTQSKEIEQKKKKYFFAKAPYVLISQIVRYPSLIKTKFFSQVFISVLTSIELLLPGVPPPRAPRPQGWGQTAATVYYLFIYLSNRSLAQY